jgi:hypothetical protein
VRSEELSWRVRRSVCLHALSAFRAKRCVQKPVLNARRKLRCVFDERVLHAYRRVSGRELPVSALHSVPASVVSRDADSRRDMPAIDRGPVERGNRESLAHCRRRSSAHPKRAHATTWCSRRRSRRPDGAEPSCRLLRLPARLKLRHELPCCYVAIGITNQARDHRPIGIGVEHHTHPAPMANVRGLEVALRIQLEETFLGSERLRKPDRQVCRTMVMVVEHGEHLAFTGKPGWLAVRNSLDGLRQRHTNRTQSFDRRAALGARPRLSASTGLKAFLHGCHDPKHTSNPVDLNRRLRARWRHLFHEPERRPLRVFAYGVARAIGQHRRSNHASTQCPHHHHSIRQ